MVVCTKSSVMLWALLILAMNEVANAEDVFLVPNDRKKVVWEGNTQTVDCYTTSTVSTVDLSWQKQNSPAAQLNVVNSTTPNQDGTYTIHRHLPFQSFKSSDAGTYICTLRVNPGSAFQAQIELQFQEECDPGKFGIGCTGDCSPFCKASPKPGKSSCHYTDGICLHGCVSGYKGANCSAVCESGKYGVECSLSCSEFCKDGGPGTGSPCNHVNGSCTFGCQEGYTGAQCMTAISESDSNLPVILGVVITVIFVIVICIFIIYHYRQKICDSIDRHRHGSKKDKEAGEDLLKSSATTSTTPTTTSSATASTSGAATATTTTAAAKSRCSIEEPAVVEEIVTDDVKEKLLKTTTATSPSTSTETSPPTVEPDPIVPSSYTPISSKPPPAEKEFVANPSEIELDIYPGGEGGASYNPGGARRLSTDLDLSETSEFYKRVPKPDERTREMEMKLEAKNRYIKEMEEQLQRLQSGGVRDETKDHLIQVLESTNKENSKRIEELTKKNQKEKAKRHALARQLSERRQEAIRTESDLIPELQQKLDKIQAMLSESDSRGEYASILKKEFNTVAALMQRLTNDVEKKKKENEDLQFKYDLDANRKEYSKAAEGDGMDELAEDTGPPVVSAQLGDDFAGDGVLKAESFKYKGPPRL